MRTYIGIDPGQNGGIAVWSDMHLQDVIKMPPTVRDIYDYLASVRDRYDDILVVIEDVGQGMPGQSSSATAKFARHIGNLEGILTSLRLRTEYVKPQKWQREYSNTIGTSKTCASKVEWKNRLKAEAQRLFPEAKITLWNADALLITLYGQRKQL